ncbi:MAG: ATP-binding protein [Patescibacteria group bacterium]
MKWSVAGHIHIQKLLMHQMEHDTLSHAYLCIGPEHVGKTTLMSQFADILSEDVYMHKHIQKEEDAQGIVVSQITDIQQFLSLKPGHDTWRIVFIHQPEDMNLESANRLLKILEEPPEKVMFILIAKDAQAVLPTIKSRCQLLRFAPVADEDMREYVLSEKGVVPEMFDQAIKESPGLPGQVLQLLDDPESLVEIQKQKQLIKDFIIIGSVESLSYIQEYVVSQNPYTKRKEAYVNVTNLLLGWLHDILHKETDDLTVRQIQELYTRIITQARQLPFNPDIKPLTYSLPL